MNTPAMPRHNIAAVHEAVAARVPDRACIVFRGRTLTFAEVTERSRRLANALHDRGIGGALRDNLPPAGHHSSHEHIAIYAYNGNEYLETMLGAFKARMAPVNVNYRYVAAELEHVIANSRSAAIVYHSTFAPTLADVLPRLPHVRVLLQIADDSGNDLLPGAEWYEDVLAAASPELPKWSADWSPDDLYLLYTGGTTGLPAGVLWQQGDIHRTAMGGRMPVTREPWPSLDAIAEHAATAVPQIVLPGAPFMHGSGQWVAFMAMNQGGTVIIQDVVSRLDPVDMCRTIEREGVTYLQIVGDAFARPILDELARGHYDFSALRTILSGGAALSSMSKARFIELLPHITIIESVGSSEAASQGVQISNAAGAAAAATFTPTEGSVVISDDRTHLLAPGDPNIGWLAKLGLDVPVGYLDNPAKTAATFTVLDGQRMSVPGDRARWLADGSIELLGRESVTINSGGEKIFAEEVEAAILHHPDVYDAVVSARPSERWGQEVVAIVRLKEGATPNPADLAEVASRHVARYKLPKAWVFTPTIQRSPAGKPDYRWAAEMAASPDAISAG